MVAKIARALGAALLWGLIASCLVVTFVPAFLDHIYYHGSASDHFDGAYFSNPDGEVSFPVQPGHRRGNLLTRFILGQAYRPEWPDHVAVTPVKPAARVDGQAMRATWVSHSSLLVQTAGLNILTDPVWSDYASPFAGFGPKRVAQPGIRFDDLPKIDIVIVSHNHYDHMDLPTLKRLWDRDKPVIITSLGNDTILKEEGIEAMALDWGQAAAIGGAQIHVMRNHHWSSRWGKDRNRALWSAFVISTGAGNIFFGGDTGAGDFAWADDARRIGPVRLALIPIGAFRFYKGQMENDAHIGPGQAVALFERLGASSAIGMHWGTFRMSAEAWGTPPAMLKLHLRCEGIADGRFRTVHLAGAVDVPPYSPAIARKGDPAPCRPDSPEMLALK